MGEAQIVRDGSLGQTAGALSGPNFTVGVQNAGQQIQGNNLFHSFSDFNVQTGQTATFTGPSSIANIINRVTGQNLSTIDGLISSRTAMPNANFFLINPNGMVLGPHASFNVGGSVNLSTADYLRMTDGAKFFASLAKQSTLSSAPVTAFGFIGETTPKPITVQSDPGQAQKVAFFVESQDAAAPASTQPQPFSLIGGDITISGRTIATNGGAITLVSVASSGEVLSQASGGGSPVLSQIGNMGNVAVSNGATLRTDVPPRPNDPFDADPGGNIFIRAGQFVMDGASMSTRVRGWNALAQLPATLPASVKGAGINVTADTVVLRNGSAIATGVLNQIITDETTNKLVGSYYGSLSGFEFGFNCPTCPVSYIIAGNINLNANVVQVLGSTLGSSAFSSHGSPRAGDINIQNINGPGQEARSVTISNSTVSANTSQLTFQGAGAGGNLRISGRDIDVNNSTIAAAAVLGGPILLNSSHNIHIANSLINNSTAEGTGGDTSLTAGNSIELTSTVITSRGIIANGGNILMNAPTVTVSGGSIQATANIKPGSIRISGDNIGLTNGASLTVDKLPDNPSGPDAGDIELTARHNIDLSNGSTIKANSPSSSGGNIVLLADNLVHLRDSQITTSVTSSTGNGGNIVIDPPAVVLQNSQISANALQGHGGTINIVGSLVLLDPTSSLDASAGPAGVNGRINIQAPIQQLAGAIAPLPQAFAIPTNLYGQRCAAQKGGQFSSFVHGSRDGLPPQPGDLIPSPLALNSELFIPSTGSQPTQNLATVQTKFAEAIHGTISFTTLSPCRS
jgi:filamentous hemagglutinin family protein